jgi:hypothetical protein
LHSEAKMLVVRQRCDFVVGIRQGENPEQASDARVYNRIRRDAAGRASARDAESRNSMKRHFSLTRVVLLGVVLSVGGVLYAQRTPDKKLILNGKATSAAILQMDGHSYLDVEALAHITNGSVRIEPNQIVLTIPNTNFDANTAQPTPALTKDFASAAIATLAEMKEWRGAMGAMVTFGLAVDGSWAQVYHERVQASLEQATVAASTNSDHNALQLLNTQYANLAKWESMVVAERQNHNGARTVAANSLRDDPVLIKFSSCGRFLSTMLGSGIFADNPNCD